jgi:outer membrane protein OmpA-like peptidoglycan-associated protein
VSLKLSYRLIIAALLLLKPMAAHADPAQNSDAFQIPEWRLMAGIDAGYATLSSSVANENSESGFSGNAKLIFGYYRDVVAFDVSAGLMYNNLSGVPGANYKNGLNSYGVLTEIGARYRVIPRLYFGPVLTLAFGSDLSFQQSSNPFVTQTAGQTVLALIGLQALYDISSDALRMEVGLRASTALNLTNRQIILAQAVFQIGIPIFEKTTAVEAPKAEPVAAAAAESPAAPPVIAQKIEKEAVWKQEPRVERISIGPIYFDTASPKLTGESHDFITSIGTILSENGNDWRGLEVEGHSDKRGRVSLNLRLSKERAESVKQVLVQAGISEDKISVRGFGPTIPLDPKNTLRAYSKNRRVEFKFFGVSDSLKEKIHEIQNILKLDGPHDLLRRAEPPAEPPSESEPD